MDILDAAMRLCMRSSRGAFCAKTGKVGDGRIFIQDVADTVRIRTGETGETTL